MPPEKTTAGLKLHKHFLLVGIIIAVVIYALTDGRFLNVRLLRQTVKEPVDKEENLSYERSYQVLSDTLLERDGIVLKNAHDHVIALDVESGVVIKTGDITERSSADIVSVSEYVGYLYMFDGNDVYALAINSGKLKALAKNCLKFIPSGNYVYYLRDEKDSRFLFRCNINGTYEKRLFTEEVDDFWAGDGNLLMRLRNGRYLWYDTITQNSLEHILPRDAGMIMASADRFYYLSQGKLYCRGWETQEDEVVSENVVLYHTGFEHTAVCHTDGTITLMDSSGEERSIDAPADAENAALSISSSNLYFTNHSDGTTYKAPFENPSWETLSF
ncbi:MAG: DUF5050 domain-containing protein [Lachnospiraceae bacterium]|nr:DUF5050 domain-containing protein [Lachnospiraceae bacterium]